MRTRLKKIPRFLHEQFPRLQAALCLAACPFTLPPLVTVITEKSRPRLACPAKSGCELAYSQRFDARLAEPITVIDGPLDGCRGRETAFRKRIMARPYSLWNICMGSRLRGRGWRRYRVTNVIVGDAPEGERDSSDETEGTGGQPGTTHGTRFHGCQLPPLLPPSSAYLYGRTSVDRRLLDTYRVGSMPLGPYCLLSSMPGHFAGTWGRQWSNRAPPRLL